MKKIIVLSEDADLIRLIDAGLKSLYSVSGFNNISKVLEYIGQEKPDVLLIDNDIKQINGLDAFRKIKRKSQKIKSIMLAEKGDINSAVLAGKAGISDFIPKPVEINKLEESIEAVLIPKIFKKNTVLSCENTEWLRGTSESIRKFTGELEDASQSEEDIILISESGVPAVGAAQIIHEIGENKRKNFIEIELSSFEKEASEAHFWSAIKELVSDNYSDGKAEKEITGTVVLSKFGSVSDHFQKSIVKYLSSRESLSIDRNIKFILVASGENPCLKTTDDDPLKGFEEITIPVLSLRKEDIPIIIGEYLKKYSVKYNKNIKGLSLNAVDLFMFYDWPGNYREMECIIETSVLKCNSEFIDIQDIPVDLAMFISSSYKKIVAEGDSALSSAKEKLKRGLIELILKYANNDLDKASKYLDIPVTVLNDEIIGLRINI